MKIDELMNEGELSDERQAKLASAKAQQNFENALEAAQERIENHGEDLEEVATFFAKQFKVDKESLADALENALMIDKE